jgi:hypothetical protein
MNERIKELKKQAWKEILDETNIDGDISTMFSADEVVTFEQKFAELIVRECVTIIKHGIDHTEYPHPNDVEKSMIEMKAQMWCRDAIKEHFGVE